LNGARFLWWPRSTATVNLTMGMKYQVDTAFRADVQPLIGQVWNDLSWRQ